MQAPPAFWGSFCKVVYEGAPVEEGQRCCYVPKSGKKQGTLCNKPGAHDRQMPACRFHAHEFYKADVIHQVTYYPSMDGSGTMFPIIDTIPRMYASGPITPRTPADVFPSPL